MTVLIVSDIHADIDALNAVLALTSSEEFVNTFGAAERIYNLGDTMDGGYYPGEVIQKLASLPNLYSVLGNHDEGFLGVGEVSGANYTSRLIHITMKENGTSFFDGMPKMMVDHERGLVMAHGGFLDIPPPVNADDFDGYWLRSYTWQRLARDLDERFDPSTGYYYAPKTAIARAVELAGPNAVGVVGHNHIESAFAMYDDRTVDLLKRKVGMVHTMCGAHVHERRVPLDRPAMFVVGAVGINGIRRDRWAKSRFGLLWDDDGQRTFSLFHFKPRALYGAHHKP
jgi:hypothetical protein